MIFNEITQNEICHTSTITSSDVMVGMIRLMAPFCHVKYWVIFKTCGQMYCFTDLSNKIYMVGG